METLNSKLFHAQCRIRESRNVITSIYTDQRLKVIDPALVEQGFVSFLTNFLGTAAAKVPLPNSKVIKSGPF